MTQELDDEQQFLYELVLHASLSLRSRAEGMLAHADTHKAVSKTIIESVLGGKRYIAQIWDARTQGTHDVPCEHLIVARYRAADTPRPARLTGLLPGCLTAEELANANAAAHEFSAWLEVNKPVNAVAAIRKFQEIGSRYKSVDNDIQFIWTLDHARACLAWLAKEGK